MQAVNSWGPYKPLWDVTRKNFVCAVAIDPVIVACIDGSANRMGEIKLTRKFSELGKTARREADVIRREMLIRLPSRTKARAVAGVAFLSELRGGARRRMLDAINRSCRSLK